MGKKDKTQIACSVAEASAFAEDLPCETKPRQKKVQHSDSPKIEIYCICENEGFGEMIQCDNEFCAIEWFHLRCVRLSVAPKGKWFCPECGTKTSRSNGGRGKSRQSPMSKNRVMREVALYESPFTKKNPKSRSRDSAFYRPVKTSSVSRKEKLEEAVSRKRLKGRVHKKADDGLVANEKTEEKEKGEKSILETFLDIRESCSDIHNMNLEEASETIKDNDSHWKDDQEKPINDDSEKNTQVSPWKESQSFDNYQLQDESGKTSPHQSFRVGWPCHFSHKSSIKDVVNELCSDPKKYYKKYAQLLHNHGLEAEKVRDELQFSDSTLEFANEPTNLEDLIKIFSRNCDWREKLGEALVRLGHSSISKWVSFGMEELLTLEDLLVSPKTVDDFPIEISEVHSSGECDEIPAFDENLSENPLLRKIINVAFCSRSVDLSPFISAFNKRSRNKEDNSLHRLLSLNDFPRAPHDIFLRNYSVDTWCVFMSADEIIEELKRCLFSGESLSYALKGLAGNGLGKLIVSTVFSSSLRSRPEFEGKALFFANDPDWHEKFEGKTIVPKFMPLDKMESKLWKWISSAGSPFFITKDKLVKHGWPLTVIDSFFEKLIKENLVIKILCNFDTIYFFRFDVLHNISRALAGLCRSCHVSQREGNFDASKSDEGLFPKEVLKDLIKKHFCQEGDCLVKDVVIRAVFSQFFSLGLIFPVAKPAGSDSDDWYQIIWTRTPGLKEGSIHWSNPYPAGEDELAFLITLQGRPTDYEFMLSLLSNQIYQFCDEKTIKKSRNKVYAEAKDLKVLLTSGDKSDLYGILVQVRGRKENAQENLLSRIWILLGALRESVSHLHRKFLPDVRFENQLVCPRSISDDVLSLRFHKVNQPLFSKSFSESVDCKNCGKVPSERLRPNGLTNPIELLRSSNLGSVGGAFGKGKKKARKLIKCKSVEAEVVPDPDNNIDSKKVNQRGRQPGKLKRKAADKSLCESELNSKSTKETQIVKNVEGEDFLEDSETDSEVDECDSMIDSEKVSIIKSSIDSEQESATDSAFYSSCDSFPFEEREEVSETSHSRIGFSHCENSNINAGAFSLDSPFSSHTDREYEEVMGKKITMREIAFIAKYKDSVGCIGIRKDFEPWATCFIVDKFSDNKLRVRTAMHAVVLICLAVDDNFTEEQIYDSSLLCRLLKRAQCRVDFSYETKDVVNPTFAVDDVLPASEGIISPEDELDSIDLILSPIEGRGPVDISYFPDLRHLMNQPESLAGRFVLIGHCGGAEKSGEIIEPREEVKPLIAEKLMRDRPMPDPWFSFKDARVRVQQCIKSVLTASDKYRELVDRFDVYSLKPVEVYMLFDQRRFLVEAFSRKGASGAPLFAFEVGAGAFRLAGMYVRGIPETVVGNMVTVQQFVKVNVI